MELNYVAIVAATAVQFLLGAIYYTFLFGKLWGRMHGFDKLSKETQQKMMKGMAPIYGVQFLATLVTTAVLALIMSMVPSTWNAYGMVIFLWLGFILPTQVSSVLFGGTEPKWIVQKIAVQSADCLLYTSPSPRD